MTLCLSVMVMNCGVAMVRGINYGLLSNCRVSEVLSGKTKVQFIIVLVTGFVSRDLAWMGTRHRFLVNI